MESGLGASDVADAPHRCIHGIVIRAENRIFRRMERPFDPTAPFFCIDPAPFRWMDACIRTAEPDCPVRAFGDIPVSPAVRPGHRRFHVHSARPDAETFERALFFLRRRFPHPAERAPGQGNGQQRPVIAEPIAAIRLLLRIPLPDRSGLRIQRHQRLLFRIPKKNEILQLRFPAGGGNVLDFRMRICTLHIGQHDTDHPDAGFLDFPDDIAGLVRIPVILFRHPAPVDQEGRALVGPGPAAGQQITYRNGDAGLLLHGRGHRRTASRRPCQAGQETGQDGCRRTPHSSPQEKRAQSPLPNVKRVFLDGSSDTFPSLPTVLTILEKDRSTSTVSFRLRFTIIR